ncbi:endonuclease/exonuclease/phosphatase family protein [Candidatus Bipolaricaulota bacterium]
MRVATFNVENLDRVADDRSPALDVRAPILRGVLERLNADVVCLQEVHGQELPEHSSSHPKRDLSALDEVLAGTEYAGYQRVHTVTTDGVPFDKRNLVILSRYPVEAEVQCKNDHIDRLMYRKVTAAPPEPDAKDVTWERPILHAKLSLPELGTLHVINLHLKSRLASTIAGRKVNNYTWESAASWAEGYFLSSIKRVGQALEARILIDGLFEDDPDANIIICGDFNAEPGEVPVEAIAGRVENTGNPDLRSSVLIPCSRAIPESVRFSHLHHGHGNLLDHMLISQSLLTYFRNAEIHNESLHDESLPFTFDTKYPESDHAPFVAEFAVGGS